MKVQEVTIHAGRTFNHPHESYSNLKPAISIRAFIEDGDDPEVVIKDLQAKAEKLVEDHKQHMLKSLEDLYYLSEAQREMVSLESQIKTAQNRVESLRKRLPQPEQRTFSCCGNTQEEGHDPHCAVPGSPDDTDGPYL